MMTTNRTNSGLAPRRWQRDHQAERELLDLLDAEVSSLPATGVSSESIPPGTPVPADQASGRAVLPLELLNR